MDYSETVSVSKGVFIFKNNFKPPNRKQNVKKKKPVDYNHSASIFSKNVWYQSYLSLWTSLEENIQALNNKMFSSVLSDLVSFIESSHDGVIEEVPTAALLTGINMPDHGTQFLSLSDQIKETVSPHVACLSSQNCLYVKSLVEQMVHQFINEDELSSDDEDVVTNENKYQLKKAQLTLPVLKCWYEHLYKEKRVSSPKKIKTKKKKKVLVVIIPDFENFNAQVLQKFVLIVSLYIKTLPFVFVLGIATSLTTLHTSLPYQVTSKISISVFNSQPSTVYLNNILENIFFTLDCPFQLGGKVFNLFTDIFLFYDLSVNNFIQNIKYAMAEHFSYGNVMALCNCDKQDTKKILTNFSHEDCETARRFMSFRKLVESEPYVNRIKLLTDDEYLKDVLLQELNNIRKYIRRLHVFLKCLWILVEDLPKAPLGKQVRELYSIAVSKNIATTPEYKECFQLLGFQSKEELSTKISKIIDYVSPFINDNGKQNKIKDFVTQLSKYLNNMNNFNMDAIEEAVLEIEEEDNVISGQMDRKQLREKLLKMTKQTNKPMNRYEKIRNDVVQYLKDIFEEYLVQPSSFYFHEIFFFDNISIQNFIIGTHRAAIHNALNDPHYYLQCPCCEIPNSSAIKLTMPDICIAYKLHLECGKMINLYDWLQAFLSILDPEDVDDDSKRKVDPELHFPPYILLTKLASSKKDTGRSRLSLDLPLARFTQAVAELEYLGFIKSSKRKADHVTRLTWGG